MRLIVFALLSTLVFSCADKYKEMDNLETGYLIIPKPVKLTTLKGKFLVTDEVKVVAGSSLKLEGEYLAEMLALATGYNITVDAENSASKAI